MNERIWQHRKGGGMYKELYRNAKLEKDGKDGKEMVVYENCETGEVWIRPAIEFFDGRFESVWEVLV